jgi:SAM-dependent methyltransferase
VNVDTNWWETFFEGPVVAMWLQAVPEAQSEREADALVRLLNLPPGARILDVPCGGGRIAFPLADRGFLVTGVDQSVAFLDHARSADRASRICWEQRDMRDLPWAGAFDGAVCAGNSFGYLDNAGNGAFLRAVRAALKPGSRFVLDTPMVLENLLGHLQPRPWWKAGDTYLLVENQYDQTTSRLNIEYTLVNGGLTDVRRGSHQVYSYRELVAVMTGAGFQVDMAEPWTRDAHTVTLIGTAL